MATFHMTWDAPEYEYREKTVSWYWTSIIIAAIIIAFSVWQKNFLFGVFIVIAEMLFIVWGNRPPRTVHFTLTENAIETGGGKSHSLKNFESMSIDDLGNGWSEIIFIFRAKLKTPFKALCPNERIVEFRNNMRTLLKEIPYEPTLIDSIEKLLRF